MFDLPKKHFKAILADPPWRFKTWNNATEIVRRSQPKGFAAVHYSTMTLEDIAALPVSELAADDVALFLWICWPLLFESKVILDGWGFEYKSCAFSWMKAHAGQIEMFQDDYDPLMSNGYWTRSSNEVCLLATRGRPIRLNADVRQGIIEPRREHSRKPDCVHSRIERLVAGPYLELFARKEIPGWTCWGDQVTKFNEIRSTL
jgi:N6-adenosine-specific RNA methylase IME4